MAENNMPTGYELSRAWFDFCFENPDLIHPNHTAIFFFAMEHCNRLGWKKKFGLPTSMAMEALGIKKYATYIKYFNELCDWGFLVLIEKSKNQYSSNIICLSSAMLKNGKALDKALAKHGVKQTEKQLESTGQSNAESKGTIDKQVTINNITNNKEGEFLIPAMCDVWYKKFSHYTKEQENDFYAMQKILQFICKQAGQTNINDPTVKEKILSTLQQIADEVLKNQFWVNKSIGSIANNIQEFYNKIKNPQNGTNRATSSKQATNKQSIDFLLGSIGDDLQRIGKQSDRA